MESQICHELTLNPDRTEIFFIVSVSCRVFTAVGWRFVWDTQHSERLSCWYLALKTCEALKQLMLKDAPTSYEESGRLLVVSAETELL